MDHIIKGIGFLFESVTSFGQTVKEKFTEGQEEKRNKENLRRKHDQENKNLKKVTSEMKPTVESEKLKSQTDRNKNNNNNNRWVVFNKPDFFENPKVPVLEPTEVAISQNKLEEPPVFTSIYNDIWRRIEHYYSTEEVEKRNEQAKLLRDYTSSKNKVKQQYDDDAAVILDRKELALKVSKQDSLTISTQKARNDNRSPEEWRVYFKQNPGYETVSYVTSQDNYCERVKCGPANDSNLKTETSTCKPCVEPNGVSLSTDKNSCESYVDLMYEQYQQSLQIRDGLCEDNHKFQEKRLTEECNKKLGSLFEEYEQKLSLLNYKCDQELIIEGQKCNQTVLTVRQQAEKEILEIEQGHKNFVQSQQREIEKLKETIQKYKKASPAEKWINQHKLEEKDFKPNFRPPEKGNIYFGYILDRFAGKSVSEVITRFYFSAIDVFFSEAFWNGSSNILTRNVVGLVGVFATVAFTAWLFQQIVHLSNLALELARYLEERRIIRAQKQNFDKEYFKHINYQKLTRQQSKRIQQLEVEKERLERKLKSSELKSSEKRSFVSKLKNVLSIRGGRTQRIQNDQEFILFHNNFLNAVQNLETMIQDSTFIFIFAHNIERQVSQSIECKETTVAKRILSKTPTIFKTTTAPITKIQTKAGQLLKTTGIYTKRTLLISALLVSFIGGGGNSVCFEDQFANEVVPTERVTLKNIQPNYQTFQTVRISCKTSKNSKRSKRSNGNLEILEEEVLEMLDSTLDSTLDSKSETTQTIETTKLQKKQLRTEKLHLEKQKKHKKHKKFFAFLCFFFKKVIFFMTLLMTLLIVFLGIFFNNLPRFPIRPNDRTPIERSTHPKLSDVSIFPSLKFLQKDNQDDLNKAYKIYTQQLQRKQQEIKQIHTLKSPPSNREKILEEKELRLENYKNFVKRREIEIANKEKQLQLEKEKQEKFFQEQTKILEDKDKDLQEQKQRNETEIQQQKKEFEETKAQEKRQRIILSIVQLLFSKWRPLK